MLTAEKSILKVVAEQRNNLQTPYYLIDETRLLKNLKLIKDIRDRTGTKFVLALKCFSTWGVFDLMNKYLDGTTASSLYETKLGADKFGGEVHAYSVGFSDDDVEAAKKVATKFIFNSVSQLKRYLPQVKGIPVGLRINPGISHSDFDLANPARKYSRLGALNRSEIDSVSDQISGAMFHCNCENEQLPNFKTIVDHISNNYGDLLHKCDWVSLGGGIYFTQDGYDVDGFCQLLSDFSKRFGVQVYLEPGESTITRTSYLVTTVLDIVHNEKDIAIVDSAVESHMPDLLIYSTPGKLEIPGGGKHEYIIAGRTCLAGDVFGTYQFPDRLKVGSLIPFADAGGYTMVKKNWFNGVQMPSIVVKRLDGRIEVVREFTYADFIGNLS